MLIHNTYLAIVHRKQYYKSYSPCYCSASCATSCATSFVTICCATSCATSYATSFTPTSCATDCATSCTFSCATILQSNLINISRDGAIYIVLNAYGPKTKPRAVLELESPNTFISRPAHRIPSFQIQPRIGTQLTENLWWMTTCYKTSQVSNRLMELRTSMCIEHDQVRQ